MIDEAEWERINEEMQAYDKKREDIIKRSRDIQKNSKQAIFSLHRGDLERANKQIADALALAQELEPTIRENPTLRNGSYANALEEWAEAVLFRTYLEEKRLARMSEMPLLNSDDYLGGVLDMTGELNRYAVQRATSRDAEEVARCKDLVEGIFGLFLQFDLRNGALRKKYDALKYTLKKLENTLYELSLTEALGMKREADDEPEPAMDAGGGDE